MRAGELAGALHAIRRLRRGTLSPLEVPACLRPFLVHGLGQVCDSLAAWVDGSAADGRAADATLRFYGLIGLPEDLEQIGATFRRIRDRSNFLAGGRGISGRQVENLITKTLADLARNPGGLDLHPIDGVPLPPHDPFPLPLRAATRGQLIHVLWGAWAQTCAGDGVAATALLHYEHEHGIRRHGPVVLSRTERARWRRQAWSVVEVARYRVTRPGLPPISYASFERDLGPRYLAVVETVEVARDDREGIAALLSLTSNAGLQTSPDAVQTALTFVRTAVRSGRDEAPELLGLLRDALRRLQRSIDTDATSAEVQSKVMALHAVLARERRDIGGIATGHMALRRVDHLLGQVIVQRNAHTYNAILSDGLRISQELAELYDNLGMHLQAHDVLRGLEAQLRRSGDPEQESQPYGWLQQLLLTDASVSRHLARRSGYGKPWLRAAASAADHASELVSTSNLLPRAWGIAAGTQRVAQLLDHVEARTEHDDIRTDQLLTDAHRRLSELHRQSHLVGDRSERATRTALLGVSLAAWRTALLERDRLAIQRAQTHASADAGGWVLGRDLDKIERYQHAGSQFGVAANPALSALLRRRNVNHRGPYDPQQNTWYR